jgi:hypothetical protein
MIFLENLTSEHIEILIVTKDGEADKNWRCCLMNDNNGRESLLEVLKDFPDKIAEVMAIWGDEPTVAGPEEKPVPLEQAKADKLAEIGHVCQQVIYGGVVVDGYSYALTEHDQIELLGQTDAVKQGAAAVPYHADGELCRMFGADEFRAVADAAMAHIFFHRTYANHLNAWVKRAETVEEVQGIAYTGNPDDLPEDLMESITLLIKAVTGAYE